MYSKFVKQTVVVFIIFIASPVSSQIRYNVIDLGSIPGYENSLAWSINNNRQVVGQALNMDGYSRAVLFDASGAGNNTNLGTLGGSHSSAVSINDLGQIVGDAANPQQNSLATIFDPTGTGNNTGLAANSRARSINNSEQIVGSVLDLTGNICHAALFDPAEQGNYITLGSLPNYDSSEAYSINDTGTIVGCTYNSNPPDSDRWWHTHAVLFNSGDYSNNIDLGTLAGYECAAALSVNNNGQIVGRVNNNDMTLPFNYNPHAVLFDSNDPNKNLDLGTLPGYDSAEAISINTRGQIVGRVIQSSNFGYDAVLFDPSGQGNNINLNDLIDHTLGWYLNAATCINDNGWIVGWGLSTEWYFHALLLVPLPAGPADFDQNGKVDFYDFSKFAAAWNTALGDENYNPVCDLETDGQINYYDLAIFAYGWSPSL